METLLSTGISNALVATALAVAAFVVTRFLAECSRSVRTLAARPDQVGHATSLRDRRRDDRTLSVACGRAHGARGRSRSTRRGGVRGGAVEPSERLRRRRGIRRFPPSLAADARRVRRGLVLRNVLADDRRVERGTATPGVERRGVHGCTRRRGSSLQQLSTSVLVERLRPTLARRHTVLVLHGRVSSVALLAVASTYTTGSVLDPCRSKDRSAALLCQRARGVRCRRSSVADGLGRLRTSTNHRSCGLSSEHDRTTDANALGSRTGPCS